MGGNPMGGALGMAQHMMQNPEAIREMTNSPIVQSLLNNPDIIRSLIADNPQIQQVIEVIFPIPFVFIIKMKDLQEKSCSTYNLNHQFLTG